MTIFIIIAAYNEARTIRGVTSDLLRRYDNVVVVDDGSTDGTYEALEGMPVHRLRHIVNRGQGAALQTGLDYALLQGADIIVTCDADGQHRAEDIERLVDPLRREEADVVLGSRFLGHANNIPWHRWVLLRCAVWLTRYLSGLRVSDTHNGLRAFSRNAASRVHLNTDRMTHASEILDIVARERLRYVERPVTIDYTPHSLQKGQSSWGAFQMLAKILEERLLR
jgi:glycosyltransferase involved in cell wall biosynthesis